MSYPGLCQGLAASASPVADALAFGLPVFEIKPVGLRWSVTCSDGHCGGTFFVHDAALKFAREEAETCDAALVRGCDSVGRTIDLLVVEHPLLT